MVKCTARVAASVEALCGGQGEWTEANNQVSRLISGLPRGRKNLGSIFYSHELGSQANESLYSVRKLVFVVDLKPGGLIPFPWSEFVTTLEHESLKRLLVSI